MTDERIRKLIQAELAGEIGMEDEAELQQLLAENPAWSQVYGEEKQLTALFKADRSSIRPPEDLAARVSEQVLKAAPAGRRINFSAWVQRLSVAAALFLVVGLSFWSGRQSTTATPEKGQAGLIESRDELLLNYPEVDSAKIMSLYDQTFGRLAELDRRHQTDRSQILQDLERQIDSLLAERRKR